MSSTPTSGAFDGAGADSDAAERWWDRSVGYQVYVYSYQDSDGDGTGDLPGLTSRLEHIAALGADLVWVTPFYRSPFADYGYDVADYCDVDPLFGTLADADELIDRAHELGLRIIIDLVPNHTSIEHPWFQSALDGPGSPHRDFYHWADPAPDGGPPNNWISFFGGPAWTFDEKSGQYYLHLFLPEQPDLNWGNAAVADAFDDIFRFWLDRGVDGFRIDVAQAIVKSADLTSNPQIAPWDPEASRSEQWEAFDHRHDILQPPALAIMRRWRQIADSRGALLLGETYELDPQRWAGLIPGDGLHVGFWFGTMHTEWGPEALHEVLARPLEAIGSRRAGTPVQPDVVDADITRLVAWAAASHDEPRPPTRFAPTGLDGLPDVERGRWRALGLSTLLMGLGGLPFIYQGEELGLGDGFVPPEARADPVGSDVTQSRDGCRTPMPWDDGPQHGFTTNPEPWLPLGGRTTADTAAHQRRTPGSFFDLYRQLIVVRRRLTDDGVLTEPLVWTDASGLVAYRRGSVTVALNATDEPLPLSGVTGAVAYSTDPELEVGSATMAPVIGADRAVIIES